VSSWRWLERIGRSIGGACSNQSRQSRQRRLDPAKTDPLLLETQIPAQAVVAQVVVQGALLRVESSVDPGKAPGIKSDVLRGIPGRKGMPAIENPETDALRLVAEAVTAALTDLPLASRRNYALSIGFC
jgi:hypothetical protein